MNGPESPVGNELDIRALRYFVAVAEELHFTRAAARLFVAQQALSREIRRLEARLGVALFVRTTRRVTLTPDGQRLLVRARELVAQHDAIWADLRAPTARPLIVDLLSEGRMTGVRVLERARTDAADVEFRSRYGGGAGTALQALVGGMLDVVFGRLDWLDAPEFPTVERRLLRLEPLALLLPAAHPLSTRDSVPVAALEGLEIDGLPPDAHAPEWTDLVRQFLVLAKARSTPPHITAVGLEEQAYHLVRQGVPILTSIDHVPVAGGVVRPLVEPIPLYAWSMGWRRDAEGPGLAALRGAAVAVSEAEGWAPMPASEADGTWLPEPDSTQVSRGAVLPVTNPRNGRPPARSDVEP